VLAYRDVFEGAQSGTRPDWSRGFVIRHLDPIVVEDTLSGLQEAPPASEGTAWGLGELGADTPMILKTLYTMLEQCKDYDAWWCAAEALEKLNQGDQVELKKRTLTGSQWRDLDYCLDNLDERAAVIGVLRQARLENTASVIVPKCRAALGSSERREVQNAVWLVERLRIADPDTMSALFELYDRAEDLSESMRPRIVEALGYIASPLTRELLEGAVSHAGYFRTRAYAAIGLGRIADQRSLPALRSAMSQEHEPSVLRHISDALYAILDPRIRSLNRVARDAHWPENGMIVDESNNWYGSPEIYDAFATAEDPQGVSLDYMLDLLPRPTPSILELGMGTGRLTLHALRSRADFEHWTALDASAAMCEHTRARARFQPGLANRLSVIHARSASLPFPDETFDAVVSAWAFPSRTWDRRVAWAELREAHRVLRPGGRLLTLGWDEAFQDELSELWYRFVPEPDFRRETLNEWRARRRARIDSTRNCHLTFVAKNLRVPLLFATPEEAAETLGFLFGNSAGEWVCKQRRTEFSIAVGVTSDSKERIATILDESEPA
jgi:SAM-dependent methyltransferase/HEAT repeat protein